MKKGKKMPSIELDGHSEAKFMLVDGKIIKVDAPHSMNALATRPEFELERQLD